MKAETAALERGQTLWLLVVCAVALGARLLSGGYLDLDHNGAWHVFIARNLSREWRNLAHPPLFILLLKACDAVSHSLLSYRAVPILAGVASVFLIGRVLLKLGTLPAVAILGALVAACAQTATVLSLAVESYTLAVLFVLAAFYFYLDLVDPESLPPPRSRVLFLLFASLALASHYFAALFLVACVAAPLITALIRPEYRRAMARAVPRRWGADLLTWAVPGLVGLLLYFFVARRWMGSPLNHLLPFHFDPAREALGAFLVRNVENTFNLFAPVALSRAGYAAALFLIFLTAVIWAPASERGADSSGGRRLLPSLMLLILLLLGALLAATARYPFGGAMRHQFLIFLFALLAGFVALDRWMRALSAGGRIALAALTLGAIGADVALNQTGYTVPPFEPLEAKRGIFREHLSEARTVHVDNFNLIGLMMEYYRWDWRYEGNDPADSSVQRYELSLDGVNLAVVVHRRWWKLDYLDGALYAELAGTWDERLGECQTVFAVYQNVYTVVRTLEPEKRAAFETRIPALAGAEGFDVRRLALDDDDVYAELCRQTGAPAVGGPVRERQSDLTGCTL